jgi:sugar fermentation stimulation protein A
MNSDWDQRLQKAVEEKFFLEIPNLQTGIFLERKSRFIMNFEDNLGQLKSAHCVNTGAMKDLLIPGQPVLIEPLDPVPSRRLNYRWMAIRSLEGEWVGTHTLMGPKLISHILLQKWHFFSKNDLEGKISSCEWIPEPGLEKSRLDWKWVCHDNYGYVEIKNVHWKRTGFSEVWFPDGVTVRGTKHLNLLTALQGYKISAMMVYMVQRSDCDNLRIAEDIDPVYAAAHHMAEKSGVNFRAYACQWNEKGLFLSKRMI